MDFEKDIWKPIKKYFLKEFDSEIAIRIALIVIISLILLRLSRYLLARNLRKLKKSKADEQVFDETTRLQFLRNAISLVIFTIAALSIAYTIPALRSFAGAMFASAGILAAFIGFASQNAFANIVSGIFIVWFKPFRVGDFVEVIKFAGTVEDITLRHTVIKNPESRRVIIPNSIISKETILNSTIADPEICKFVEIRIGYSFNIDRVMEVLREEAEKHPDCLDKRTPEDIEAGSPKVLIRVMELGETGFLLRAYVWAATSAKAFGIGTDLNYALKKRFEEENIPWPYPHRHVIVSQPEEGQNLHLPEL
ncbi:MAG: mechanosensitive ion channel family protein [Bacteroidota bacterium]